MNPLQSTSEIPYLDLMGMKFELGARGVGGLIDCRGLVLLVYRRAGIELPDLPTSDRLAYRELFERVEYPNQILDVAHVEEIVKGYDIDHVAVLVRPDTLLHTTFGARTVLHSVNRFRSLIKNSPLTFWRLKPGALNAACDRAGV